jgi:hypothetical protein
MPEKHNVQGEWKHPGSASHQQGKGIRWWFLPLELLGMIGPLIGAIIGLAIVVIGIWALSLANAIFQSLFISLMIAAVERNLALFFACSLVMGYCDYFARRFYAGRALLWPVGNAVGFAFSAWIIAWVFKTVGALANVLFLSQIGDLLRGNLLLVFALVLALGYFSVAARHFAMKKRV